MIYAKLAGVILAVLMLVGIGFYAGTLDGAARADKAETKAAKQVSDAEAQSLKDQRSYETKYAKAIDDYLYTHRTDSPAVPVVTTPVRLCRPPKAKPAPGLPGAPNAGRPDTGPGPVDGGNGGVDIRPAVNSYERRWEETLAQCRLLRDAWPGAPTAP